MGGRGLRVKVSEGQTELTGGGSAKKGVRYLKEWEFKGSVQGGGRSKGRCCPKQGQC